MACVCVCVECVYGLCVSVWFAYESSSVFFAPIPKLQFASVLTSSQCDDYRKEYNSRASLKRTMQVEFG